MLKHTRDSYLDVNKYGQFHFQYITMKLYMMYFWTYPRVHVKVNSNNQIISVKFGFGLIVH